MGFLVLGIQPCVRERLLRTIAGVSTVRREMTRKKSAEPLSPWKCKARAVVGRGDKGLLRAYYVTTDLSNDYIGREQKEEERR